MSKEGVRLARRISRELNLEQLYHDPKILARVLKNVGIPIPSELDAFLAPKKRRKSKIHRGQGSLFN